jgi:hypothetical protein
VDQRKLTRRERKRTATALLRARDLPAIAEWARRDRRTRDTFAAMLYEQDELLCWRAIEAIGRVAAVIAESDLESVRSLLRRLFWSMNDESGTLGWHSPEAIGEILANVPPLIDEFGVLLPAFLWEEPFERGTHWAVARVARLRPDIYADRIDELTPSLRAEDPYIRGCAVLALGVLGAESSLGGAAALRNDRAGLRLYDFESGQMCETSVAELVAKVGSIHVTRAGVPS